MSTCFTTALSCAAARASTIWKRSSPKRLRSSEVSMPWLSASLVVSTDQIEPLSEALMNAGALSVDVCDADAGTQWEHPIFDEPDHAASAGWSRARVSALFDVDRDVGG